MQESRQRPSGAPEVKILSEREIQDRLYGGYLGRRRSSQTAGRAAPTRTTGTRPAPTEGAPESLRRESQWTGSEILSHELERLRAELITLRREKEKLATTLDHLSRSAQPIEAQVHRAPAPSAASWLGKLTAVVILLAAGGYAVNDRLQALPATGDATPFTVQAAVYDTRIPAQLAVQFLENLSYGAFLVEVPRKDGRVRYRVCVGSYVTKEEAATERLRLVGDPRFEYFKDAFVRLR